MHESQMMRERREAFDMFSADGLLQPCDLGVALQASGFKQLNDAKVAVVKQRYVGSSRVSFPLFCKVCDCLSGRPLNPTHVNIPPPVNPSNVRSSSTFGGGGGGGGSSGIPPPHGSSARSHTSMPPPAGGQPHSYASTPPHGGAAPRPPGGVPTGSVFQELDTLRRELNKERARSATLQQQCTQLQMATYKMKARMSLQEAVGEMGRLGIEACSEDAVDVVTGELCRLKRGDAIEILGSSDPAPSKALLAKLHPDRVQIPCAKQMLQRRFQLVNHARNLLR